MLFVLGLLCPILSFEVIGAGLTSFEIEEPLGQTWTDEWLTQKAELNLGDRRIRVGDLRLIQDQGQAQDRVRDLPAQFYQLPEGDLLKPDQILTGTVEIRILFQTTLPKNAAIELILTGQATPERSWEPIVIRNQASKTYVDAGRYELVFDTARPLPINKTRTTGVADSLGQWQWPEDVSPTGVTDHWLEKGPARAVLRRTFAFSDPDHRYQITFDIRARDPWLGITDTYQLGRGSFLTVDLRGLNADHVFHPYAYNARTFKPGGPKEDSTLQPPQHPIATLGPVWRDIWYNGGPYAFVYRDGADHGIGFAAVRGSQWKMPSGVTPESQNLEIHGDSEQPGEVEVRIPTNGGTRHWAMILGTPELRHDLSRLTRSHADIPLNQVLHDWVLEWESDAPSFKAGAAGTYLGSRRFPGFGAMLRGHAYDRRHESFVTIKAGPARNHYQGDELSFYFCSLGTPLAIDHACHYSPRPWSAAMHNRPDMNNHRPVAVAKPRAFQSSSVADVFVADERTTRISEVPIAPHETTKPGWEYPTTYLSDTRAWQMRRYVMLVKHDPNQSQIADYMLVRDEIRSPQPVWWNLHLLARSIEGTGPMFRFPGQLDVDLTAQFLSPDVSEIEKREWGWSGDSGRRREIKGKAYENALFGEVIPENFQPASWNERRGEHTQWLRVRGEPGKTEWMVILLPHLKGQPAPEVERLSPTRVRVTLGNESETIHLGTQGRHQAAVKRNGQLHSLLHAARIKPLDQINFD